MRFRRLPRTDLTLSEIGMPVANLMTSTLAKDASAASHLLQQAFELGITHFAATDVAGEGEGERLLAASLGHHRAEIVISTTGGYDWAAPDLGRFLKTHEAASSIVPNWTPGFIRKACESSLRRLRTDYIDLYLLHHPDMRTLESDALFDVLQNLRREGKVRSFGCNMGEGLQGRDEGAWRRDLAQRSEEIDAALRDRKVPGVQTVYNILQQKPAPLLFSLAAKVESGIIAEDPFAGGLLDADGVGDASPDPRLRELAFLGHHGVTLVEAALKFVLADVAVTSALPAITHEDRLAVYVKAIDAPPLTLNDTEQLRDLHDAGFGVG